MKIAEFRENYQIDRSSKGVKAIPIVPSQNENKKHKYAASRTVFDGIVFDSAKEAQRFQQLKFLEEKGIIQNLESNAERRKKKLPKISYELKKRNGNICKYEPDFEYFENGKKIVEDTKGFKTAVYEAKKKLMLKHFQIEVKES